MEQAVNLNDKAEQLIVVQPTICDLMECSIPGSSVLHYLLEFA